MRRLDYRAGLYVSRLETDSDPSIPKIEGAMLQAKGVVKRFGGLTALNKVNFAARPGNVTALIGPNGSGKTTALNMISGFYRTDAGEITLDGTELTVTKARWPPTRSKECPRIQQQEPGFQHHSNPRIHRRTVPFLRLLKPVGIPTKGHGSCQRYCVRRGSVGFAEKIVLRLSGF